METDESDGEIVRAGPAGVFECKVGQFEIMRETTDPERKYAACGFGMLYPRRSVLGESVARMWTVTVATGVVLDQRRMYWLCGRTAYGGTLGSPTQRRSAGLTREARLRDHPLRYRPPIEPLLFFLFEVVGDPATVCRRVGFPLLRPFLE